MTAIYIASVRSNALMPTSEGKTIWLQRVTGEEYKNLRHGYVLAGKVR